MSALSKLTLEPGKSYHILNRGNNRRTIFDVDRDYLRFLDLLEKYILPIAKIQAYALLSNHFHLAVAIREESELEEFYLEKPARIIRRFGHLQNAYAKYFIHRK